jgi:hypothetical protein
MRRSFERKAALCLWACLSGLSYQASAQELEKDFPRVILNNDLAGMDTIFLGHQTPSGGPIN